LDNENDKITNNTLAKILKDNSVTTVLDLSCGTGSQVFHLIGQEYIVTGSDISAGMLKIAKAKAEEKKYQYNS
jgi:ubiquinone/menaquinone biosynthesis C-methylase UbiE